MNLTGSINRIHTNTRQLMPAALSGAAAAFRQVAAEASKIISAGHSYSDLPALQRLVVEPATRLWRAVETEAAADPLKFPQGFNSFDLREECIEGLAMALPGVLLTRLIEARSPRLNSAHPLLRTSLYTLAGQVSYQLISQNLGPFLHDLLKVNDVSLSMETAQQLYRVISATVGN